MMTVMIIKSLLALMCFSVYFFLQNMHVCNNMYADRYQLLKPCTGGISNVFLFSYRFA